MRIEIYRSIIDLSLSLLTENKANETRFKRLPGNNNKVYSLFSLQKIKIILCKKKKKSVYSPPKWTTSNSRDYWAINSIYSSISAQHLTQEITQ